MIKGYDLDSILGYVDQYVKDGIDKDVALQAAAAIARGIWKRDHPETTMLPEHLKPGNVRKSVNERRDKVASDHTANE